MHRPGRVQLSPPSHLDPEPHQRRARAACSARARLAGQAVDVVVDLVPVPSWDLSVEDMASIAGQVRAAVEAGSEGVVVTHGTDTMEETAWLTELTLGAELRDRAAVLFTGTIHFADDPASDGPARSGPASDRLDPHRAELARAFAL